ncbi:hypothetical protein BD779DRAFT_1676867 [Infundibulicybe gibba]|nr:hypothetical protein BD779DRAFT_1676867 [Infundibulicybe gibba]
MLPHQPRGVPGYPGIQAGFDALQQPFSSQPNFLPQDQSLHPGADPNSPEIFKQNIQMVQNNVARVQDLARRALNGIQNAYHPGSSPAQTEADIASLTQSLEILLGIMKHTGVGGLPLLPTGVKPPPESVMLKAASAEVQTLFAQLEQSQNRAAVTANYLGAPENTTRGR